MHKVVFTGFDSAWGRKNKGALCHLGLRADGALEFLAPPNTCGWNDATRWAGEATWENHVVAIDQRLVVNNRTGMRPVERKLASALMKDFKCGAHASNTSNPCYGPAAGIWDFVEALESRMLLSVAPADTIVQVTRDVTQRIPSLDLEFQWQL